MPTPHIDLNCDLGEGCPHDGEIIPLITSANVACGFHAGDPQIAFNTMQSAVNARVHLGAHPGFPDREHFGRREIERTEDEIFQDCLYQIGALIALARAAKTEVRYIKPHGALYNMACREDSYARPILAAAEFFQLPVLGLPNSRLHRLSEGRCRFVAEGFADRRYTPWGTLVPRNQPDAMIDDVQEATNQVRKLIDQQGVETICVHGDNPMALDFVRHLRNSLLSQGFTITSFT